MTDDIKSVPISEMGIGDGETEERLEDVAQALRENWGGELTVQVKSDILSGVAHIQIEVERSAYTTDEALPTGAENYLISEDMAMFAPDYNNDLLTVRVTTRDVYTTWSGTLSPLED